MHWNAVRFDPTIAHQGHVESYFFKLNDPEGQRALWLKATLLARTGQPAVAEAWAIAFERGGPNHAAKLVVPVGPGWGDQARFSADGLAIRVGPASFDEGKLEGALLDRGTEIRWGLRYEGGAAPLVPFPSRRMYTGSFPRSKLVSPCPDARFSGFYEVNGRRVEVEGWRGMQGHNWGKSHAYRYAWAHCNQFDDGHEAVFEGLTGRIKLGPAVTPPITLLCLHHRGSRYHWTRPLDWLRSRGSMGFTRWSFSTSSDLGSLEGELSASTEGLVGLTYENPSGPPTYCLNSKLASVQLSFRPRGRPALHLKSRSGALEIGTTDPDHGVRVYL